MSRRRKNPNPAHHDKWDAPDGETYPLVDLPHGSTIIKMPVKQDVKRAIPLDRYNCALARCASREADGLPARVGVDKAYIPMFNERGEQVMYRCKVPKATVDAIDRFDATGEWPRGGFRFTGIPPSARLDSQRSKDKRRRARWSGMSAGKGPKRQLHLRSAS